MIARRRTVPAEIVAAFGSAVRFAVFAGERPQVVDQADAHVASQYVGSDILDIVFADVADEAFVLVQNIVNLYADLPALVFNSFLPIPAFSRKNSSVNLSVTPRYLE